MSPICHLSESGQLHQEQFLKFSDEWKGLPLIMRLINSCAIMG